MSHNEKSITVNTRHDKITRILTRLSSNARVKSVNVSGYLVYYKEQTRNTIIREECANDKILQSNS